MRRLFPSLCGVRGLLASALRAPSALSPQAGGQVRLHLHRAQRPAALRDPQGRPQEAPGRGVWPRRPHRCGRAGRSRAGVQSHWVLPWVRGGALTVASEGMRPMVFHFRGRVCPLPAGRWHRWNPRVKGGISRPLGAAAWPFPGTNRGLAQAPSPARLVSTFPPVLTGSHVQEAPPRALASVLGAGQQV